MKKLSKLPKSKKLGLIVLAVVAIIAILGVAGSKDKTGNVQSSVSSAQVDKSITAKMLLENAGDYKGKVVELTGKVFNTEKKGSTNAWQVWTEAENSKGNVIVYYSGTSDLGDDDYIKFVGEVGKVFEGENAFGGKVDAPTVQARSVAKIGRDEAVAPAIKSLSPAKSQTKGGMTITIQKVDFAADETRVYLEVNNGTSASMSFYSFNAKMVQSGSQVKPKSVYPNDQELPSDIVANTKETGKIYHEKADPNKPLTLSYEGSSSADYEQLTFSFDIP